MVTLKLIAAAIFILLAGCATNPTEGMTPAEAQSYELQAEYERANRRILMHESILTARADCDAANMTWLLEGFSSFDIRRMDRDPTWLPKNAHPADFACLSSYEVRQITRSLSIY